MWNISVIIGASVPCDIMAIDDKLPWHGKARSADMAMFKFLTFNRTVVMGSKTWDSLPENMRPLPFRKNVVITSRNKLDFEGTIVCKSVAEALIVDSSAFWIGGAEILRALVGVNASLRNRPITNAYITRHFIPIKASETEGKKVTFIPDELRNLIDYHFKLRATLSLHENACLEHYECL